MHRAVAITTRRPFAQRVHRECVLFTPRGVPPSGIGVQHRREDVIRVDATAAGGGDAIQIARCLGREAGWLDGRTGSQEAPAVISPKRRHVGLAAGGSACEVGDRRCRAVERIVERAGDDAAGISDVLHTAGGVIGGACHERRVGACRNRGWSRKRQAAVGADIDGRGQPAARVVVAGRE